MNSTGEPRLVNGLNVFYSNCSSFSLHTKKYIFSLPKEVSIICLVETHAKDDFSIENDFTRYGFAASSNKAENPSL